MYNAFAQSLMKKYGWTPGEGIGKDNQGITQPIKARFKFDSHGLAYKEIDADIESKWSTMFSSSVSNLQIQGGNKITIVKKNSKEEQLNLSGVNSLYKSFMKSNTLMKDGIEVKDKTLKKKKRKLNESECLPVDKIKLKKKRKEKSFVENVEIKNTVNSSSLMKIDENSKSDNNEVNLIKKEKTKKKKQRDQENITNNELVANEKVNEVITKKRKKKLPEANNELNGTSNPIIKNKEKKKNKEEEKSTEITGEKIEKKKTKKVTINDLSEKQILVVQDSTLMTCHLSARCGITMSGKLARIQKLHDQEQLKSLSMKS